MGPFDSFVSGMQEYAQGKYGENALTNLVGLGLAATGNAGEPTAQDKVLTQGMNDLAQEVTKTGGNPAQAMMNYVRTPKGQALMKLPRAFPTLVDRFQDSTEHPRITTR